MSARPLGSLSPSPVYQREEVTYDFFRSKGFGFYLFWFVVIALILWAVFYFGKFGFVQKTDASGAKTGVADGSKSLLWAVVISLVIVLIIWAVQSSH